LWKTVWRFFKKLKTELSFAQTIQYCVFTWRKWSKHVYETAVLSGDCSTIHKSQKTESSGVPINWWMGIQNVLHNGILVSHKKESIVFHGNMDRTEIFILNKISQA
jgi:hypothetical protein